MKIAIAALFLLPALSGPTAIAQRGISPSGGPIDALQEQIELLGARISALEEAAHTPPNPSVEGRTYCAQLTNVNLFGRQEFAFESDRIDVSRFEVTFNSGFVTGSIISAWRGSQSQTGEITLTEGPLGPPGPLVPQTFSQNGRKVDLTVGPAAWTLYVSADGSVIHGSRISAISAAEFGVTALSTITYVEDATAAGCNPEFVPGSLISPP